MLFPKMSRSQRLHKREGTVPPSPSIDVSGTRLSLMVLLPFGLALALFAGTFWSGFVFDDVHQILNNPWIRDFRHLPQIFNSDVWAFEGKESNYYRPLMHVVNAGIYVTLGPTPWVFHLVNVLLHSAVTIVFFVIVLRILKDDRICGNEIKGTAALLAASMFAAHPIHTEAVAWVGGLPDVGCTLFFLASILLFIEALENPARSLLFHVGGALSFFVASLFKEPGVTLPGIVLLLDVTRHRDQRPWSFWVLRYGTLTLAVALYAVLRFNALKGIMPHASESQFGLWQAFEVAGAAIWRYLAWLVAPLKLNAFHTMESSTGLPPILAFLGPLLALAWALWKRSVPLVLGIGVLFIPLLPALYAPALLPGLDNPWAERYAYLPSAGFIILMAIAYAAARRRFKRGHFLTIAVTLLIALFGVMTISRNSVWKSNLTLWTDTVRKSPNSGAAQAYLGYALFASGDINRAIQHYEIAIRLKPDFSDTYNNLGVALASQGRHREALPVYLEAIRLRPRWALPRVNLSITLSALGAFEDARVEAERAIKLDPRSAKAYHALGCAFGNLGRLNPAAEAFKRAIELDPYNDMSRAYLDKVTRQLRTQQ
jgi:protein O-mannosyl-transferase